MTTALQQASTGHHPTAEEATRIASKWPRLLKSPLKGEAEADQVRQGVVVLSQRADHVWLMARIAALLHPYYVGSAPRGAIKLMAEDWAEELGKYPQWEIT